MPLICYQFNIKYIVVIKRLGQHLSTFVTSKFNDCAKEGQKRGAEDRDAKLYYMPTESRILILQLMLKIMPGRFRLTPLKCL